MLSKLLTLLSNDIALLNKLKDTYTSLQTAYNVHLFGTSIRMGDLYVLTITGMLAPILGKEIGNLLNSKKS